MGFSRQEYWTYLPFPTPGDLPNPGIEPASLSSPALAGGFFITEPPGKPCLWFTYFQNVHAGSVFFPSTQHLKLQAPSTKAERGDGSSLPLRWRWQRVRSKTECFLHFWGRVTGLLWSVLSRLLLRYFCWPLTLQFLILWVLTLLFPLRTFPSILHDSGWLVTSGTPVLRHQMGLWLSLAILVSHLPFSAVDSRHRDQVGPAGVLL